MAENKIVVLHTGDKVNTEHLEYTATDNGLCITGYDGSKFDDKAKMLVIPANFKEKGLVLNHHDVISYQGEGYAIVEGTPDSHVLVWDDELSLALNVMKTPLNYADTQQIEEDD